MLSANLGSNLDLKDLASECGLSISYFCRAFRVSTGLAPHQWQIKRRIEVAKSLLRDNRKCLAEIAVGCGFTDQSHFTRIFTREVGTSPGQWRRCIAA
jgi:AraC-like DNA-binding protein